MSVGQYLGVVGVVAMVALIFVITYWVTNKRQSAIIALVLCGLLLVLHIKKDDLIKRPETKPDEIIQHPNHSS